MKHLLSLLLSGLLLTACSSAGRQNTYVGEPKTDTAVVYMTQEISPAALVRVYEALGRPAEGRVL